MSSDPRSLTLIPRLCYTSMMEVIEQFLLGIISSVYQSIQWPGVVLLMAIESACIPLPSELILPFAGWILIKAQNISPLFCLAAGAYGALGNLLGSIVAYAVGMWGGRPFLERYGKYILITRHDLDVADKWFAKHGTLSAGISRVMPVVRTFISLPAGIARMNFTTFCVYTIVGSFFWSTGLAYGGYVLGEHWEQIRAVMRPFDIPILIILLALIGYYVYRHIKHFREHAGRNS